MTSPVSPGVRAVAVSFLLLPWPGSGAMARAATSTWAEFVRQSQTVLAGTVERAWVETDRRVHEDVQRVAFNDLRVVKGPDVDHLHISFWAGDSAGNHPIELRAGERYILVSATSLAGEGFTPIVVLGEGLFPILVDSERKNRWVHDLARRPVVRMEWDRLVVVAMPSTSPPLAGKPLPSCSWIEATSPREDPGTRVNEDDFLRTVREILSD